jgi:hypothetical protein
MSGGVRLLRQTGLTDLFTRRRAKAAAFSGPGPGCNPPVLG